MKEQGLVDPAGRESGNETILDFHGDVCLSAWMHSHLDSDGTDEWRPGGSAPTAIVGGAIHRHMVGYAAMGAVFTGMDNRGTKAYRRPS
jgi:hypothetical protein